MGEPSDRVLWERAARGDSNAFGALFERHAQAIYNYCFRRTASWSAAEDLTAAVFLEGWRRRADVRLVGESVLPWLYVVGANLIRNRRRRLARFRKALERLSRERSADDSEDVAGRLDDERRVHAILELVSALPAHEQDVFVLCAWQGLGYAETAQALGIPVGTVRSRLARARARLRHALDEDGCASNAAAVGHGAGGTL